MSKYSFDCNTSKCKMASKSNYAIWGCCRTRVVSCSCWNMLGSHPVGGCNSWIARCGVGEGFQACSSAVVCLGAPDGCVE